MARYRVVRVSDDLFLVQRKRFFGGWKTTSSWSYKKSALEYFYKDSEYCNFNPEQIIIESD